MSPDSAPSARQLTVMTVVAAASLAAWLTLVLLADRRSRGTFANAEPCSEETEATMTRPASDTRPAGKIAA